MIVNVIYSMTPILGESFVFSFGANGNLISRSEEDLIRFKMVTGNHPLIMGRKTFESIGGKPLPNRRAIVISSTLKTDMEGVTIVKSLESALEEAEKTAKECFVIGGASLIEECILKYADYQYFTLFSQEVDKKDIDTTISPSAEGFKEHSLDIKRLRVTILGKVQHVQSVFGVLKRVK